MTNDIREWIAFPLDPIAVSNAGFGEGEGPILLDDSQCDGSEAGLQQCTHNAIGHHDCGHHEDAGVICPGNLFSDNQLLLIFNYVCIQWTIQIGID